jgi:hypothetical protein
MDPQPPLVRARFCQEWLTRMDALEEPYRGRFFAALDEGTRSAIDSSSRVAWIPIEIHVRLADVTHEALGAVRAHAYYRASFAPSINGPILGPLLRTSAKLLGISVNTFVRWASRAWEAVFSHAGEFSGEVLGHERARLVYRGLPAVCTDSDAWLRSAEGSVYGAFDLLGVEGVVRPDWSARSQGGMVLNLEWMENPSSRQ